MTRLCARSAALVVVLGCACQPPPRPDPHVLAVEPARVDFGKSVTVRVQGEHFYAEAQPSFGGAEPVELNYGFTVWVGGVPLSGEAVRFVDTATLDVALPGDLPAGVHDVEVMTPAGRSGRAEQVLEVVGPR